MNGTGGLSKSFETILLVAKLLVIAFVAKLIFDLLSFSTHYYFASEFYDAVVDRLRHIQHADSFGDYVQYLLTPHNEHIIATTRLITALDDRLWHGRGHLQIVASYFLQLCSAILVCRCILSEQRPWSPVNAVYAAASVAILFFNGNYLYNLAIPFQLQHFILAFLVVLAANWISRVDADENAGTREMLGLTGRLLGLAAIATVTLGNAPVVLIAAAAASIIGRWRSWSVLLFASLALAHTALMLSITSTNSGLKSHNVFAIAKFAMLYIGGPFIRMDAWPAPYITFWTPGHLGVILGILLVFIAAAAALKRMSVPGWGGRTVMFGLLLMIVVIVTAFVAGYSRAGQGIIEGANKKYSSFAGLGWVGALMVLVGAARELRGRFSGIGAAGIAAMLLLVLPLSWFGQQREFRIWTKAIDRNWEYSIAMLLKINDQNFLGGVYSTEHLTDIRPMIEDYLEPLGRGIFSDYPFRWGDNVKGVLDGAEPATCRQVIEAVRPIEGADRAKLFDAPGLIYRVEGWSWMEQVQAPARDVLLVDDDDRLVGLARSTRASASAEEWLGQKLDGDVGWFGFLRLTKTGRVRFFGRSADGRMICSLGELGVPGG